MFTITPAVFAGLPAHKPRILIVSLRDLGDALLAAALGPAVRFLRPDAETWLLTFRRNASIIEGVPGIDGVITVEDKPNLPDLLSDLRCLWNPFRVVRLHAYERPRLLLRVRGRAKTGNARDAGSFAPESHLRPYSFGRFRAPTRSHRRPARSHCQGNRKVVRSGSSSLRALQRVVG